MFRRMFGRIGFLLIFVNLILARAVFASPLAFSNLSSDDVKNVTGEFAAVYVHSSVSPAATLGEFFGFEFGVIGGVARTPHINDLVNLTAPNSDVKYLPDASLLLGLSIPMGLKFELEVLPPISDYGVSVKKMSYAFQWNLSDTILPLPFDFALKYHVTQFASSFSESLLGVSETVSVKDQIYGLQFIASKTFVIVEPYFILGVLQAYGTIDNGSAPNSIFAFTNNNSAASSIRGFEYTLGSVVHFGHFNTGLEISHLLTTNRALMKLSANY